MDFDPRIISDGYGGGPGRSCNFHFGHGRDVIEEDAENEKSCVQVLKFMIAKADNEIHDLEDELAILQCQLKWNESDKKNDSYEASCATFKQNIDSLASSIQRLKDENVTRNRVIDEALKIQGPTERICDIINTLLRNDFTDPIKQDKQCGLTISEEFSSNGTRYEAKDTTEEIFMSKSDDEVPTKDEIDASRCPSEEKSAALPIKLAVVQTPLLASPAKRDSSLDALTQEKGEVCRTESETGESGSSSLSVPAVTKVEKVNYATIAIDSLSTLQGHGIDIPIGNHLKRKLHSDLGVASFPTPMLEPLEVIEKWEPASNSENSTQSGSFFKKERGSFFCKPNKQKKLGVIGAKKQRIQRVKKENATIVSPVSDFDDLKRKISRDPNFLKKLKVAELREFAKQNNVSGLSKSKKEHMIDEIVKRLGP